MLNLIEAIFNLVLESSLRGTVFAIGVLMVAFVIRYFVKTSFDFRHRVWSLILIGLVVVPLLCATIPQGFIPLPISIANSSASNPVLQILARNHGISPSTGLDDSEISVSSAENATAPTQSTRLLNPDENMFAADGLESAKIIESLAKSPSQSKVDVNHTSIKNSASFIFDWNWEIGIVTVWLAVAFLLLVRLFLALLITVGISHDARRVDSDDLGLPVFPMRVFESSKIQTPVVINCFFPRVILPLSWRDWSHDRISAVLAHEGAHIRRRDGLIQLLAEIVVAVYWFHPLAWINRNRLLELAELACDAEAVNSCGDRFGYAKHLIAIAGSNLRCKKRRIGIAMANSSHISRRVRALIGTSHPLSARTSYSTVMILLFISIPMAVFISAASPLPQSAQSTKVDAPEGNSTNIESKTLFERVNEMEVAAPAANATRLQVHGFVRKPDLTPARSVVLCIAYENSKLVLLGRTVADARGHYSLNIPLADDQQLNVFAVDIDDRLGWESYFRRKSVRQDFANPLFLILHDATGQVEGRLLAPGGRPMKGIEVAVTALIDPIDSARSCSFGLEPFEFRALSDAEGHFSIQGLPEKMLAILAFDFNNNNWGSFTSVVATSSDTPDVIRNRGWAQTTNYFAGSAEIKLFPKCEISGSVVDAKGRPISGASIDGNKAITDDAGQFKLRGLDLDAWGSAEATDYFESHSIEPPLGGQFQSTYFRIDREQMQSRTIKPVVLEGTWISGRILSSQTKQPIIGIHVVSKNGQVNATSDDDGRFRGSIKSGQHEINFTPAWMSHEEQQLLLADPKSRAVRQIDVVDDEPVDMGTILLDVNTNAAKPITVKVVMSDGTPVADCRLELSKFNDPDQRHHHVSLVNANSIVPHVLTDQMGVALVKPATGWAVADPNRARGGLRAGIAANAVLASYPSESPRYFGNLNIPDDLPNGVLELKVSEAVQIRGQVTLNGAPLEGVIVAAGLANNGAANLMPLPESMSSETNEQGNYVIYAPSPQGIELTDIKGFPFHGWGIGSVRKYKVNATRDASKFIVDTVELVTGERKIIGIVLDSDGKPISGANISCERREDILIPQTVLTDQDGKFALSGLTDGELTVVVRTRNGITKVQLAAEQSSIEIVNAK